MKNPIELAYEAKDYVPTEEYCRGQRKKMYNPIHATPVLVQAMDHIGEANFGVMRARERAWQIILEPEARACLATLDWQGLRRFLSTLAMFLKASPVGKEKGMRTFQDQSEETWDTKRIGQEAKLLADILMKTRGSNNDNKLRRLSARVKGARNKWEALASLAQFYPLSGVPQKVGDELVAKLEVVNLATFQDLVAQMIIFYRAFKIAPKEEMR